MALNISIIENITVSESALPIKMPSLYQTDLGIVDGSTYQLSFDSSIDTGTLQVYQGAKLIYDSSVIKIGNLSSLYDYINVSDHVLLDLLGPSLSPSISPSSSISPSASTSLSPSRSISPSPSVSVSPSISKSPSASPSLSPSISLSPSLSPSVSPSISLSPSLSPSVSPSISKSPSVSPSVGP